MDCSILNSSGQQTVASDTQDIVAALYEAFDKQGMYCGEDVSATLPDDVPQPIVVQAKS